MASFCGVVAVRSPRPISSLLCRALADNGPPMRGQGGHDEAGFPDFRHRRAVGLGAGIALAGTPLPNPPFSGGGFVPPTKLELTQELNVGKLITNYAKRRTKCDQVALIALQLAYEPVGAPKVPEVQQKWDECVQKVNGLVLHHAPRQAPAEGHTRLLDQAAIDAFRAAVDAQFPLLGPIIYCDDDAAAPDLVTGLNIPDFKQEAEGEVSAAKAVLKAGLFAGKCNMNALKVAFKFAGSDPAGSVRKD